MREQSDSGQTIGNLTRSQLEEIVRAIAKKTIEEETTSNEQNQSCIQSLAATFGAWSDEQTDEEIIKEIYDSRNSK